MLRRVLLLILFLGLVPHLMNAQKPGKDFPPGTVGVDFNQRDAKGKKEGPWIRVYKDQPGTLYYRGQFRAGTPTGVFEFYGMDGSLTSRVDHVKDSTINDVTFYHTDGHSIKSQGRYIGSLEQGKWVRKKQGIWKTFDPGGVLRSEENYTGDQLDGVCTYYFSDGRKVAVYNYLKGVKEGSFITYYDNGKKEKEGTYVKGNFHGELRTWRENGLPESEGKYTHGKKEGTWHFYSAKGPVEVSILYKNGVETKRKYMNGTFTLYYDNGIPMSEYTYEEGKRNGPFREWYDMGKFVQVPGNAEDLKMGVMYREKLEGTQLRVEGDYLNDALEGEIRYYTQKGLIERIETWSGGELKATRQSGK